ncbi:rna recognition motif domain containing protein [Plasmopara halstedii]|uniref:Rna recognition motif domain containing protein n=1 Tax=Plasmopara halstedii TaxID=4781 RepID=A0A0P1AQC4_PLAHL|nr:rna recognition motif domain containing protein [Plasmopara halstedii]CEG43679.1 rna recognition motif domain containing protein [Plasmopara halstedii]|eukprot:XP_024580048.1 rna recognition motif domain containing protein [Plasmopara halstedii]
MANNLSFARGGASSWADDDDIDIQPLPVVPKTARMELPQPIEEEENQHQEQNLNVPQQGHEHHHDDRHNGYEDQRGGHDERRREPREERSKNAIPETGPWKLFVGNLSFRLSEDDLADFIGPDGIKDIRFPRDHDNRLKGFAYVEFYEKEYLVRALDLDDLKLDGRHVKMDVALDRERKPRENSRHNKRNERLNHRRERNEPPPDRQRLTLLPRSTSSEEKGVDAYKPSIFGEAKPRDETAYLERKQALDRERKEKAKEAKEAKAKAEEENKIKSEAVNHKNGHHDGDIGRGRGNRRSSDGGRGDRRSSDCGRGRGPGKENTSARKVEPRSKRTKPPTKVFTPVVAKMTNVFELLNDSDSD